MQNIYRTEDGTEVPMNVGDRMVDETNTVAVEYLGLGEWRSLINAGGERWLVLGAHPSPEAAENFAIVSWEEEFSAQAGSYA